MILLVGGSGSPDVRVLLPGGRDSNECRLDPDIPEVPQSYGSPGRVGSIAAFRGDSSVIVCGGVDDGGPPFSSFKDCQTLDLRTRRVCACLLHASDFNKAFCSLLLYII